MKTFDLPPFLSRPQPFHGTAVGMGLACVIAAAAVLARFALEGTLPAGYPFLTFFPAAIITSFLCGTAAGTLCALLCGVAAWYWFIPPAGFALDRQSAFALGFYVFIVAVDIVLIHLMTRAMRRLEAEKRLSNALAEQQRTMFEELFADWSIEPAYTDRDYFEHLDGKKRYDGVAALLRSPLGGLGEAELFALAHRRRRESHRLRQLLLRGTPVPLQKIEQMGIDVIQAAADHRLIF